MNKKYRFKCDKLVRDNTPDRMQNQKIFSFDRIMDISEYLRRLNDKVFEELQEVIDAENETERTEEFADVIEVLLALKELEKSLNPQTIELLKSTFRLANYFGINFSEIEKIRIDKRMTKGGFANRIYCEYIEMYQDNPHIKYYLNKPDKYPIILEL